MRIIKKIAMVLSFLFVLSGAAVVYGFFIEPKLLVEAYFKYKTPLLQKNLRVVFFSDTHFGKHYEVENAERITKLINKQKPDIVVFGGDLIDDYYRDKNNLDIEFLTQEFAKINASVKIAVYGNHDYGGGGALAFSDIFKGAGFTVLNDESLVNESLGVEIIGVDDLYYHKPDMSKLVPKTSLFPIYICHEPDIADKLISDKTALMFSGHTHGGQVLLPFLTKKVMPAYGKKYRSGDYSIGKGTLYVSSGIGMSGLPARFLNVPQIVVADIVNE